MASVCALATDGNGRGGPGPAPCMMFMRAEGFGTGGRVQECNAGTEKRRKNIETKKTTLSPKNKECHSMDGSAVHKRDRENRHISKRRAKKRFKVYKHHGLEFYDTTGGTNKHVG